MNLSDRAQRRQLIQQIDKAVRHKFGEHVAFRIYCDVSDGDPDDWTTCIHHVKRPPNAKSDIMFPPNDKAFTRRTADAALRELLTALTQ